MSPEHDNLAMKALKLQQRLSPSRSPGIVGVRRQKLVHRKAIATLVVVVGIAGSVARPAAAKTSEIRTTPPRTAPRRFEPAVSKAFLSPLVPAVPAFAKSESDASTTKPKFESFMKLKSLEKVVDDHDVVVNSEWTDSGDFAFVDAGLMNAPLHFVRPLVMDFRLYPKVSSAIKKMDYNPQTQIIEVEGEASGLSMHSWIKVDQRYWDEIRYEIVQGDMYGFKIQLYLWDKQGKTVALIKGLFPQGKSRLPKFVALVFKPVSEIVLSVATKNFRSYIEGEYKKKRNQP